MMIESRLKRWTWTLVASGALWGSILLGLGFADQDGFMVFCGAVGFLLTGLCLGHHWGYDRGVNENREALRQARARWKVSL